MSNEVGVWVMPSVPSGSYTVSVTAQGFRTAIIKEIKLDTGATATVDARADYDLPDGKQHFTFAGGYASGTGIYLGGLGPSKTNRSDIAGYAKMDYVRGSLRITGYVNTFSANDTFHLFSIPPGSRFNGSLKPKSTISDSVTLA